jgi:predicted transcriptional regulator
MQYDLSMPRYTIDFDKDFDKTLSELVETTDATTKADVIRRAVASYSYLKKQQRSNKDAKIVITDDDKLKKEIVLP